MIFDTLERSALYSNTHPLFEKAFDFAKRLASEKVENGKYELSDGIYASVSEYSTNVTDSPVFEDHRLYIDIQILLDGKERILICARDSAKLKTEYKPDAEFYSDASDYQTLNMAEGRFALLFPGDLHAPGLAAKTEPEKVKKIVIKVPVDHK